MTPKGAYPKLVEKFKELSQRRKRAIQERQARLTLGPSVIRVFADKTSDMVRPLLERIELDDLTKLDGQAGYKQWFERNLHSIAKKVLVLNNKGDRPGIHPGYRWGHSSKILNSFMQGIVRQSRYFSDIKAKRIEPWLYVPLDSVVMSELRACGVSTPKRIKEIRTATMFYDLQDKMEKAAKRVGAPRILFDDVWASDRK
jgi:hypothetical protein